MDRADVSRAASVGGLVGAVIGGRPSRSTRRCSARSSRSAAPCAGALLGAARARAIDCGAPRRARRRRASTRSSGASSSRRAASARRPGKLEGTVVAGQYRIVRRMGSGASGVIYEAVRESPTGCRSRSSSCAPRRRTTPWPRDRLRREAEALGLAWHPNVVEVIDHGHLADGTAYLVMELPPRRDAGDASQDQGAPHDRASSCPIAMQVCDALVAVHAAGVVHRDLKPSNIFLAVDRRRPGGRRAREAPRLRDRARRVGRDAHHEHGRARSARPGYMSPEQEIGRRGRRRAATSSRSARCSTSASSASRPRPTPSGLWRSGAVQMGGPVDSGVHKAAKLIPPAWKAVIARAMAPVPADRFQDARQFAVALRGLRDEVARGASGSTAAT